MSLPNTRRKGNDIMISKSMSCDRCGKKIENNKGCYNENYALRDSSAKITLWGVGEARSTFGQRIDLCEDCYISFIDWIEESEDTE